jgi:hypothetical protein
MLNSWGWLTFHKATYGCQAMGSLLSMWIVESKWFQRQNTSLRRKLLRLVSKTEKANLLNIFRSRASSVGIVSGYGLDDWAIGVRSPAGARGFSSNLCVQAGSGAYPAFCTMGIGGTFPGGKARPGRYANHSPHLVPRSWMSRSYTSSPPQRLHRCVVALLYL